MEILLDWILIISASIMMYKCYKNIIYIKNCSIANYIILIIYFFCVLPIFFNYTIGIPTYSTIYWYKPFINSMQNEKVNIIYDLYILTVMVVLFFRYAFKKPKADLINENTLTSLWTNNKIISNIIIVLPAIIILLTGTLKNYMTYNVSASRGFSEDMKISMITPSLLLSIIAFFSTYFKEKYTVKKVIVSIIYFFLIVWISGKRFMIANILILCIFYIVNSNLSNNIRKKIFKYIPILLLLLLVFSGFYLTKIRPLSDTSIKSVYEMLRVDFGRDDVIKYVIDKELINETRILDYRGQSFISLIFFWIPRSIWNAKPYPHYMYLTGSILNLNIHKLPAGTTPSFLEMTICNFGIYGIPICIILLCIITKYIDKSIDIDRKAIFLILTIVLLTQSMDVYIIIIILAIIMKLFMKIYKNKKLKFILRK